MNIQAFIDANQAIIGLVILAIMFIAFVLERYPATVVAVIGVCAFLALGLLDPSALLGVFSNPAPITVGAMFILSGALLRTGMLEAVANLIIARAKRRPKLATFELVVGLFPAAAFMNNTPVVIIMIPIVAKLAAAMSVSVKKLLIPLSYLAMLSGTLTLVGTSTNLLVDGVATDQGLAPFGIFEITTVGIIVATAGTLTLLLLGKWLLPAGDPDLYHSSDDASFLSELIVPSGSAAVGRKVGELATLRRLDALALRREGRLVRSDLLHRSLRAGDRIVVRCHLPELLTLRNSRLFRLGTSVVGDAAPNSEVVVEATISPTHPSIGRKMKEIPFLNLNPVRILGISRHGHLPGPDLGNTRIRAADKVLVTGSADAIQALRENPNLIGVGNTVARAFRRDKAPIALGALAGAILLSAFGILPIVVAAILAVGLILATRCIDSEEAWQSIDGNVLILIFAMLAVGAGLDQAGSVSLLIGSVSPWLAGLSPLALLFVVYLCSSLLTEAISNNAVAVIMTPIAIGLGSDLGVDPRPLVIAVMFAASASFATPISYQTNTMVYAAGDYRFVDFVKIGIPMNIVVGITACLALWLLH